MADINNLSDTASMLTRMASRLNQLADYGLTMNDVPERLGYSKLELSQVFLLDFTLGELRDIAQALFVSPQWLLTGTPEPDDIDPVALHRYYCRCVDLMHLGSPGCPIHGRVRTTRSPYQLDMGSHWAAEIEERISRRLEELDIYEHELADAHGFSPRTWGELKVSTRGYDIETVERFLAAINFTDSNKNGSSPS